jgi:DNA-binding winged helix-turn-helix (wHTH) protein
MRVRFGECVFDSEVRQVTVAGRAVGVSPRALELLALLLAHRPQAMRQAELRDRLWPDTVVSYSSLARLVTELRRAVGDRRRQPRFIRTVHGFGYAFCGEANEIFRPPARSAFTCSLVWETREIALAEGENVIGRTDECVIRIDSRLVSRRHARILVTGDAASIEDLGSKNGTFVAKRMIHEPTLLADGDEVRVGSEVFSFRKGHGPGSTQTG